MPPAEHAHRRPAIPGLDARAHQAQRLGDTLHRAARQRLVADQGRVEVLPGQQPGRRVAWPCRNCPCRAHAPGRCSPCKPDSLDVEARAVVAHRPHAHRLHRRQRRQTVLTRQEATHFRASIGQSRRASRPDAISTCRPARRYRPSIRDAGPCDEILHARHLAGKCRCQRTQHPLVLLRQARRDPQVLRQAVVRHRPNDDARAQQRLVHGARRPLQVRQHEVAGRSVPSRYPAREDRRRVARVPARSAHASASRAPHRRGQPSAAAGRGC